MSRPVIDGVEQITVDNTQDGKKKKGRPPKAETVRKRKAMLTAKGRKDDMLIRLAGFTNHAVKQLELAVKQGKPWALKMYFEYFYGKPTEMQKTQNQQPKINVEWIVKPESKTVTVDVPSKE